MLRLFKVLPQYLLPQHALSACMYRLTRIKYPPLKNRLIRAFIRLYHIDMREAAETDISSFTDFNAFFTRALRPGSRPIDNDSRSVLSPVDGRISQIGIIENGRIVQAKGRHFTVSELLGGDPDTAEHFTGGAFVTLYLAPPDYHRIHMPVSGSLQIMTVIPGRLFSVNPATTHTVDRLFARNERIVNVFAAECGTLALVMVGAIFVGSMATVWAGEVTPLHERIKTRRDYGNNSQPVVLERGEEMGRFNMGSTVILLFESNQIAWHDTLKPGDRVRMGEKIGSQLRSDAGKRSS